MNCALEIQIESEIPSSDSRLYVREKFHSSFHVVADRRSRVTEARELNFLLFFFILSITTGLDFGFGLGSLWVSNPKNTLGLCPLVAWAEFVKPVSTTNGDSKFFLEK